MDQTTQPTATGFDAWCIIDLYGHQQIAGKVTEQNIAGAGFVRVDVPESEGQDAYTRLFGPGAIYSIVPTEEQVVRAFVARCVGSPIQPWMLALPEKIDRDKQFEEIKKWAHTDDEKSDYDDDDDDDEAPF